MFPYKWHPFQILIHPWEQKKKVARAEVRQVEGDGTQPPFCFYPKEGHLLMLQGFNENGW
jgi:hypothetical protein